MSLCHKHIKLPVSKCMCVCVHVHENSLGEVGELPPPSVDEVEGGLASTGRGTGRAIGGGGGGGSMGVGRKGLWTLPWELPLGWGWVVETATGWSLSSDSVCVCEQSGGPKVLCCCSLFIC